MSYRPVFLFLAASAFGAAVPTAEVKVIANPSVSATSVSSDDVKEIFLLTKTSLKDTGHVEPVLEKSGTAHEHFVRAYLNKTDAALQNYYRSLVFSGKGSIPKEVASDSDVVAYVSRTKGAIGYVSAGTATAGVKILEVH